MSYSTGGYMDIDSGSNADGNRSGLTRKPMGEQTLRPLTIKQIKNCDIPQEEIFRVDNADVTHVTIIGIIRNVSESATNYIYAIEDGTGCIDVKKWIDQNGSPEENEARHKLGQGVYVRVNGKIDSFGNRITVMSHAIRPIEDFNEISYHFLDVIRAHLMFTKPGDVMETDSGYKNGGKNSIYIDTHNVIKQYHHIDHGCSIDEVLQKLSNKHYSETEVRETIAELLNDGHCYTTINEEYVKSCM